MSIISDFFDKIYSKLKEDFHDLNDKNYVKDLKQTLKIFDKNNNNIIHYICEKNDVDCMKKLMSTLDDFKKDFYSNLKNIYGYTPINIATKNKNIEMEKILTNKTYSNSCDINNFNVKNAVNKIIKLYSETENNMLSNNNMNFPEIVKTNHYGSGKETSKIHEEVIKMLQEMDYSEEDAKIIKAGLYSYTKEQHPELTGLERAKKLKSYVKKKYIKMIDQEALKEAISIAKENKLKK